MKRVGFNAKVYTLPKIDMIKQVEDAKLPNISKTEGTKTFQNYPRLRIFFKLLQPSDIFPIKKKNATSDIRYHLLGSLKQSRYSVPRSKKKWEVFHRSKISGNQPRCSILKKITFSANSKVEKGEKIRKIPWVLMSLMQGFSGKKGPQGGLLLLIRSF